MVRVIILFLWITTFLFGNSSVLNISYFPNSQKVDVLFSLDKPFNGKIVLLGKNDYKIEGVSINRIEQKKFQDFTIVISPYSKEELELKILHKKELKVKASITAKGYGLRIRISGFNERKGEEEFQQLFNKKENRAEGFDYTNYFIVIAILIILIIILFIIKKKTKEKLPKFLQNDEYKLIYQKMIDPKNRIVLVEVFGRRYLLLLGEKNNLLLDRLSDEIEKTIEEIEKEESKNRFDKLLEKEIEKEDFLQKASRLKDLENV